jgi:4-hydroxy-tetrahydrodipicolinate synthase
MASARLSEDAAGIFVIAATPFAADGGLDLDSAADLVEFYIGEGVAGITFLGVMGEAPKLSESEQIAFARHVLDVLDGRLPAIFGVSNPGLDNLARLTESVMTAGAAGVMVAGVPGLRTDTQIRRYFDGVLAAIGPDVPVCLQDYPPTTTVYFSIELINALIEAHAQIVMFKHEDCPGHRKLSALRRAPAATGLRRVSILTGNGGLYLPQELARGADGAMTGFAFPGMLVEVHRRFAAGDAAGAEDLYDLYLPLIRHEQQFGTGLAIRKEVLRRRGAIRCNLARAPGPALDDDDRAELDGLLTRLCHKLELAGEPLPRGL